MIFYCIKYTCLSPPSCILLFQDRDPMCVNHNGHTMCIMSTSSNPNKYNQKDFIWSFESSMTFPSFLLRYSQNDGDMPDFRKTSKTSSLLLRNTYVEIYYKLTSSFVVWLELIKYVWKPERPTMDHTEKKHTTASSTVIRSQGNICKWKKKSSNK